MHQKTCLALFASLLAASGVAAGEATFTERNITGAPGGEKDAACAQVGIDKISKGLGS